MIEGLPKDKQLILFDGICNLCNSGVTFVIKHDKHNVFMFAPLQSKIGEAIISKFNIDTTKTDSIILYSKEKGLKTKSSAAIGIGSKLGFPCNLISIFYIIPPFIRNWIYDYIARNRYKWYGKRESCMVPTPELQAKFIA